ncbi:MAG TPA: methyltransferase [Hyphomicrobiaceae bacterium]|jgi:tRNA1(Val) A37 N6-methylase TrmN6
MNAAVRRASHREESDDAFLGGRLRILQPGTGYRAGLDAVLLAATVEARRGAQVLDVGAGVGVVGLCVAHRLPDVRVTLVERDARLAALARRNVERNDLGARVRVVEADLLRPLGANPELAAGAESYDHVLANPPFHVEGRGTAAGDPVKAAANAMPAGTLDRWARFLAAMARPSGLVTLIHRADALAEVLAALEGRFGGTVVVPVHPQDRQPAARVLVRAVKGSRAPLELLPGLILHNADHSFRPGIAAVLRDGGALPIGGGPCR